ncbi:MAG: ABC transporter permease [Alphaproteobacteria bacterium]
MRHVRHIFHLGTKELLVLARDLTLALFVLYSFTLDIKTAGEGMSLELRNASIAIVDEDHSPLSARFFHAFRPPNFREPVAISFAEVDQALDSGRHTFVLVIPPRFQADLLAGRDPDLQLNIDATAISQAYVGSGHIRRIVAEEIGRYLEYRKIAASAPVDSRIRIKYNPNRVNEWYDAVIHLLLVITNISVILPATALLREREHGTLEHLLVLPLGAAEIMFAKIWPTCLLVLVAAFGALHLVVQGSFGVPFRGSEALFFAGTLVYLLATTGIGMMLATVTRSTQQLALVSLLVLIPLIFLSGTYTPIESMPRAVQWLTVISPMRYYVEFSMAVIFRGAGVTVLWPQLLALALIGAFLFLVSLLRFRAHFAAQT